MAKSISLTFVTLLIDRDASTKLPVTVPEYERAILEEIYGEENVSELSAVEIVHEDFDIGAAYEGMVAKYRSNADSDAARARYFNRARDLERFLQSRQPTDGKRKPAKPADGEPAQ